MSLAAVEINDARVTLVQGGKVVAASPGYARLGREPLLVGEAAQRTARVEPLSTNSRFWADLDQEPLPAALAGGRSRADLAWLHLKQLLEKLPQPADAVVCAVPASLRPPQLAVLLGIVNECGTKARGMIDSAVAAASTWPGQGRFIHLDLHLHHALLSAVQVDEDARLERSEIKRGAGIVALHEGWVRLIARRFVTQTRFDPLHRAADEQTLFDSLPGWLAQLDTQPIIEAEMTFGTERHRVQLTREEIQLEAAPIYAGILSGLRRLRRAGHTIAIGIGEHAARLPGLIEQLAQLHDSTITIFPAGSAVAAAAGHAAAFSASEESATLLRTAPRLQLGADSAFAPRELAVAHLVRPETPPTHVLYRGQAHALGVEPLVVGLGEMSDAQSARSLPIAGTSAGISRLHCSLLRRNDIAEVIDYSRYGTWLNDERIAGRARLQAGDRLRVGSPGAVLELIALG